MSTGDSHGIITNGYIESIKLLSETAKQARQASSANPCLYPEMKALIERMQEDIDNLTIKLQHAQAYNSTIKYIIMKELGEDEFNRLHRTWQVQQPTTGERENTKRP